MTTPSAIDRITAHAARAGQLMKTTDQTDQLAGSVLDAYEASLKRFQGGLASIDEKRKALDAVLPALGNATAAMDAAFQDQKSQAAGASVNGEQLADHANHPMPPSSPSS
jgi:hypothetical protein